MVFLSQRNSGVVHFPSSTHASYSRTATSYLSIQNWSIKTSRCAERDEGEQGGESLHLIDLENRAAKPPAGAWPLREALERVELWTIHPDVARVEHHERGGAGGVRPATSWFGLTPALRDGPLPGGPWRERGVVPFWVTRQTKLRPGGTP